MKDLILKFLISLVALHATVALSQESRGSIIGSLAAGEHLLELWVVEGESMYVVKNKNGQNLSAQLSASQLSAHYPRLGKLVQEGVADDASLGPAIRKAPGLLPD